MARNASLRKADKSKNDEFYTKLSDVQNELTHYDCRFLNKIVYCNCDNPFNSNFFKYFALNFKRLGLKRLICTCYGKNSSGGQSGYAGGYAGGAIKIEINAAVSGLTAELSCGELIAMLLKNSLNRLSALKGDGDFRSDECMRILKASDIVVTNPPFSLFREYVATLIKSGKGFLIIGNQNAVTYKDIFYLLKSNKIWLGYKSGTQEFLVPPNFCGRNVKTNKLGERTVSFGNICWFTNLNVYKRHKLLPLADVTGEKLAPFDNYPAINVDRVCRIPVGYSGAMGVPITFLSKYNPAQFEIIDAINRYALLDVFNTNRAVKKNRSHTCNVGGRARYFRIIIKAK